MKNSAQAKENKKYNAYDLASIENETSSGDNDVRTGSNHHFLSFNSKEMRELIQMLTAKQNTEKLRNPISVYPKQDDQSFIMK